MSDHFDWTTEEDESVWEEQTMFIDSPPNPKKRPLRGLAVLGVLFLIAAGVIYWQVQSRIEVAMADVRADLLSTHNLVNRAVAMQDVDLLAPLLSGRDMTWTRYQEQMMRDDGLFGRSALGLPLAQPPANLVDGDERLVSLELTPDLNGAELQFVELYRFGDEEVPLRQTAVYRRGRERWLMSPPDEEFWGAWETTEVSDMTFMFPERDAELGKQLAIDLSWQLLQRCRQLETLQCPDLAGLTVRFEPDVAGLVAMSDPATVFDAGLRLDLPSPTLVGYPLDDAGYDVLLQVYEAQIFTAVLSEAVGYQCCHHAPFVQAITDYYLAEIGLKPWPVSLSTYAEISSDVLTIERLFSQWATASFLAPWDDDYSYVYGFVDFLMNTTPDKTALALLQQLNSPQGLQLGLGGLFDGRYGNDVFIQEATLRDWWIYARAKSQDISEAEKRPLPLPNQDLEIVCAVNGLENDRSILLRYDTETSQWQEEKEHDGIMFLNPLPDDTGIVLQAIDFETNIWQAFVLQNGETYPLADDEFLLSLGQMDASGQHLVAFTGSPETEQLQPILFDLANCNETGCASSSINDVPIWSPNGEYSLLTQANIFEDSLFKIGERVASFNAMGDVMPFPIVLGDALGQPVTDRSGFVENGMMPFWITDEMFGYIGMVDDLTNPTQELRVGQVDDLQTRTLIGTTNLLHAISEDERPVRLTMRYAVANRANPNILAVMASYQQDGYLFTVDHATGEVQLRLQAQLQPQHLFGFSPDGRYLVASANPEGNSNNIGVFNAVYVHDIAANKTEIFETGLSSFMPAFTFDWSADGDWLAYIYGNGFVWLYAPEFGYQELLSHDFGECSSIAWVD